MRKCNGSFKKALRGVAMSAVTAGALFLCACGGVGTLRDYSSVPVPGAGEKTLARISVADGYQKTSYVVGEDFDPRGMNIVLSYTDGSEQSVSVTSDMLANGFDTSDFTVEVTPPVYDYEPDLSQPTSRQVMLTFANEGCEELPYQFRLHAKGEVLSEDEIPTPHAPSNDVYFGGWYFDPNFIRPIDYVSEITADTMFYAQWLEIDYAAVEADCINRTALIVYDGEYTEFEYKVYKNVDEWYFDFERNNKGAVIGENVDLIYEVDDEFSTRGLYMTGGEYGGRVWWGMPVNKGMLTEFDTSMPGGTTVKLEFAGRTFEYPITVIEKTLITSEGVTVSDSGQLLNLSGNSGRYLLPENTYSVPNDFSAGLNGATRNNIREIVCPSSVTRIGDNAFDGMTRLQSVTLGEGVLYIGGHAFANCPNLKSIYVYATEPPYIMNSHFMFDISTDVKIYVPLELLDVYIASPHWCNYSKQIYAI